MTPNSTVVVTGAFGALGRAVAKAAAEAGARVVGVDLAPVPDASTLGFGADALLIGGVDLTDADAAAAAMGKAADHSGRIDALLNLAGGFQWRTLAEGELEDWDRLYRMNVRSTAAACRAALPHLLAGTDGAIVNVGANAALKAAAGMGPYAASKAGVHRLTESLAEELRGKVRVNAVMPSVIDTPANRKDMPDADTSAWIAPSDLAAVILFLASDAARAVTGALLPVTG